MDKQEKFSTHEIEIQNYLKKHGKRTWTDRNLVCGYSSNKENLCIQDAGKETPLPPDRTLTPVIFNVS